MKIPYVFQRLGSTDRLPPTARTVPERTTAGREVSPGCEWVLTGEGRATVQLDGVACLVKDGRLHRETPDGWVPVQPAERVFVDAFDLAKMVTNPVPDGTYELIGPRIKDNLYGLDHHELRRHGESTCPIDDLPGPRTYDKIKSYLQRVTIEGIVFHHPDGRMAKVTRRELGLAWPPKEWKQH